MYNKDLTDLCMLTSKQRSQHRCARAAPRLRVLPQQFSAFTRHIPAHSHDMSHGIFHATRPRIAHVPQPCHVPRPCQRSRASGAILLTSSSTTTISSRCLALSHRLFVGAIRAKFVQGAQCRAYKHRPVLAKSFPPGITVSKCTRAIPEKYSKPGLRGLLLRENPREQN